MNTSGVRELHVSPNFTAFIRQCLSKLYSINFWLEIYFSWTEISFHIIFISWLWFCLLGTQDKSTSSALRMKLKCLHICMMSLKSLLLWKKYSLFPQLLYDTWALHSPASDPRAVFNLLSLSKSAAQKQRRFPRRGQNTAQHTVLGSAFSFLRA